MNPVPSGLASPVTIDDPVRFKARLGLYPNASPFVGASPLPPTATKPEPLEAGKEAKGQCGPNKT